MTDQNDKEEKAKEILRKMESVLVAFSGGVDSTLLLKLAMEALGERTVAVVVKSESFPQWEFDAAMELAQEMNAHYFTTEVKDFSNQELTANPVNRCYFCKSEFFEHLNLIAKEHGFDQVVDGTNTDDLKDYRPGIQAKKELGIRSPLAEAGLNKEEVRLLANKKGLRNWNKPSFACLNSRIPFGSPITPEKIDQIDQAEFFLKELGFTQIRVRHHGEIARIEIMPAEFEKMIQTRDKVVERLKKVGFEFVTLDLMGFISGSLNPKAEDGS